MATNRRLASDGAAGGAAAGGGQVMRGRAIGVVESREREGEERLREGKGWQGGSWPAAR